MWTGEWALRNTNLSGNPETFAELRGTNFVEPPVRTDPQTETYLPGCAGGGGALGLLQTSRGTQNAELRAWAKRRGRKGWEGETETTAVQHRLLRQ